MQGQCYTINTARKGEVINIQKQSVLTIHEMKLQISKQTQIDFSNIRLFRNNKTVKDPDETLLSSMSIQNTDTWKVSPIVTNKVEVQSVPIKNEKKNQKDLVVEKKEEEPSSKLKMKQEPKRVETQKQKEIRIRGQKWIEMGMTEGLKLSEITFGNQKLARELSNGREILLPAWKQLQKIIIKKLVTMLLNRPNFINNIQNLSQEGLIQFLISKVGQLLPGLDAVIQDQRKGLKTAIGQWCCLGTETAKEDEQAAYIKDLPQSSDEQIISSITKLASSEGKAREIVEMSQNNIETAINIVHYGHSAISAIRGSNAFKLTEDEERMIPKLLEKQQQQIFLFRWLMSQANYLLRLRLQADQFFYQVYTLSIKHFCKGLFNLLVKHRSYMLQVVNKFPAPLKRYKN